MKTYNYLTLKDTDNKPWLKPWALALLLTCLALWAGSWIAQAETTRIGKTLHSQGGVDFAFIQVPVPITDDLEGQDIEYVVKCHLEDGQLACEEGL